MRWLIVVLMVSLVGLLVAAAGMARHIWLVHKRQQAGVDSNSAAGTLEEPALEGEAGIEPEN